ncbi:hypothetical protein HMPREF9087_1591 [Enterococcus casseliflavus ATCC 12755]|uniref:Uncharacterized protein n=1 Tax=Enterococcus casseliflavus ATCC 12755 TaxID=888066 RepID=F0EJM8_ENTCA|nr:hypothetical protein HMPREF9087_1591 [Enterococcus casseliflavus ATCC 12755]
MNDKRKISRYCLPFTVFQEASLVYQRINRSTFSKKSKVSSQE